jgi:hypothetical protein
MDERERGLQPLEDAATGCTLVFVPAGPMYQPLSALASSPGCTAGVSPASASAISGRTSKTVNT